MRSPGTTSCYQHCSYINYGDNDSTNLYLRISASPLTFAERPDEADVANGHVGHSCMVQLLLPFGLPSLQGEQEVYWP